MENGKGSPGPEQAEEASKEPGDVEEQAESRWQQGKRERSRWGLALATEKLLSHKKGRGMAIRQVVKEAL